MKQHLIMVLMCLLGNSIPSSRRWISRREAIEWCAQSRDLTPLEYIFYWFLKRKVYTTKLENLKELQNRILDDVSLVDRKIIRWARRKLDIPESVSEPSSDWSNRNFLFELIRMNSKSEWFRLILTENPVRINLSSDLFTLRIFY